MLNCIITVGDKEFTSEQFVEYIMENGLGALTKEGSEPNPLRDKILRRFDVPNLEDSISEIWTNLERQKKGLEPLTNITQSDVEEQLNPLGQLSDYGTQKQIRYNTYSGIALTGISANFGKMMGYLFDAENVRSITNGEEEVYIDSDRFVELGGNKKTPLQFINSNPEWKIASRNIPTLKNQYHFTVNGVDVKGFTRDEIKLVENQQPTNVFETIDTIINLAIDNVKEGKLHLLGITNSNSNAYLALVGMGLPLSVTSRIFKTPALKNMNEGGRWISKNINKNELDPVLNQLATYSLGELTEALETYTGNPKEASKIANKIANSTTSIEMMREAVTSIPIQTEVLDRIYTDKSTTLEKLLSDAAVLSTMKKLIPVGEQMFAYAQIFSLLRGMPSKKWKLDSIIDRIEGLVEFEGERKTQENILALYTKSAKDFFRRNDPEFQRLLAQDEAAAEEYLEGEFAKVKDSNVLFGTPKAETRASFVNRLIRGSVDETQTSPASSVFEDNIVTRLPHVMAAYRVAVELRTLMEKAFRMHAPAVRKLAERIVEKANIFSPFDRLEKTDYIQKEIVKYLGSNLRFTLDGVPFSTEIPASTETFSTTTTTVSGAEAWAQRLIRDVNAVAKDISGNEFLDSLETVPDDATGLRSFRMLANKINDEEVVEQIRDDFGKLATSHPEMARNLFKYALLTEGMYYERTGLALVFPDMWAAEFSQALEQRIDSIIPLADPVTEYNLELIEDSFIYQFVRNNPEFIGYPRDGKAKEQGTIKNARGGTDKIYRGEDNGVFFDLIYPGTSYQTMPRFIKFFSDDVYLRLDVEDRSSTYYVKVVEGAKHSFYDFTPYELEKSLDLDKLAKNTKPLVNKIKIRGDRYTGEESDLKEGQLVWAFDKSAALVTQIEEYRIEGPAKEVTLRDKKHYEYKVSRVRIIDVTQESQVINVRKQVTRFLQERLGNTITVDNVEETINLVKNQPYSRLLTAQDVSGVNVISLPIGIIPSDINKEDEVEMLKELFAKIHSLNKDLTYYVDANILEGLNNKPSMKRKIAEELHKKIAFTHPTIKENTPQQNNQMSLEVELRIKDNEIVSAFTMNTGEILPTPDGPGTHLIAKKSFYKKGQNKVVPGAIVKMGENAYAYVDNVTFMEEYDGIMAVVTQFPASLVPFIDTPILSKESFEKLILEKSPC